MRVVLVGPELEDNLTLRYLASSLHEAGHEATIARFDDARDAPAVLEAAAGADLVGLSLVFQSRAAEFFRLAAAIRARSQVPLIAGGHFATCAIDRVMEAAPALDAIALHEGERTLVEVADRGADPAAWREIPGLVLRDSGGLVRTTPRPVVTDLDALPHPDRAGPVRLCAGVPTASILGSRGCLNRCDYCCITTLHATAPGPRLRSRSPEDIAAEVAALYHERGIRQLLFHDDTFLLPRAEASLARLRALEAAWRAEGVEDLGLVIKCRPDELFPEVLDQLVAMGLVRLFMGVESGSDAGLASLGRCQSAAAAEEALARCARVGVSAQFTIMAFHPDATLDTLRADLAIMRRHLGTAFNFGRAEAYASTPLEARVLADGRARGTWLARTYAISDPVVDRVARLAVKMFHARCWSNGSLMQDAIGLDHLAAVLERFHPGRRRATSLAARSRGLVYEVGRDLVELLGELVDATEASGGALTPELEGRLERLSAREQRTRAALHERLRILRAQIDTLAPVPSRSGPRLPRTPRTLMAAVAAGSLVLFGGSCEYEGPPLEEQDSDGDGLTDDCEDVFGTHSHHVDSDADGIPDPDEDHDGDGVSNWEEQTAADLWYCEMEAHPELMQEAYEASVLARFRHLGFLPTGEIVSDLVHHGQSRREAVELVRVETGAVVYVWVDLITEVEEEEERFHPCLVIEGPGECVELECDADEWLEAHPDDWPCAIAVTFSTLDLGGAGVPDLVDAFVAWGEDRDLL